MKYRVIAAAAVLACTACTGSSHPQADGSRSPGTGSPSSSARPGPSGLVPTAPGTTGTTGAAGPTTDPSVSPIAAPSAARTTPAAGGTSTRRPSTTTKPGTTRRPAVPTTSRAGGGSGGTSAGASTGSSAGASNGAEPTGAGTPVPQPSDPPGGWGTPVLVEDFHGDVLDLSRWYVYDSPNAPAPQPRRLPAAVSVANGSLRLTGFVDAAHGDVSGGVGDRYGATYGRWEVRVRAEAGVGYSPVVLLWPKSERWPDEGEIDVLEIPDGTRQSLNEFLHYGADNHQRGNRVTGDFTEWHTFAVDWLPDRITYWIDGIAVWSVQRDPDPAKNVVPNTAFRLALQNDQGCQGGCRRDESTPATVTMYVDWVKVYAVPAG